jgi:hypothetical protein
MKDDQTKPSDDLNSGLRIILKWILRETGYKD